MLIERRLKWQRYGFRHEVEDGYHGENFCAKKDPRCRAVYLMTSVSREIQGAGNSITFKKSLSDANKTIALLNANILDNSSRSQSHLMTVILVTGKIRLLERVT